MEGVEMEEVEPFSTTNEDDGDDLCTSILSRLGKSKKEEHQHLCTVVGAMSQELKDKNLPLKPVAYFGATITSLDLLSRDPEPPVHTVASLLTLLSIIIPQTPPSIVKKKRDFTAEAVVRILRSEPAASDAALTSGLKCLAHLIALIGGGGTTNKVVWSEVSHLYGLLHRFVTDHRSKVRAQSHSCLHDVLKSFQGSAVLANASEGITDNFQRFLLLAGGSKNSDPSEGGGAQEVLYILDALKNCLPLMSTKFITSILNNFKKLLEFRQPLVTRRITGSVYALCLQSTSEVAPEALLDLLSSLAALVSPSEKSVDGLTFTARLLDVGIIKVYSLNRQICVVKLPLVFSALGEILATEHEEAIVAASMALKNIIHACIDEALTKQGVDQIILSADGGTRKSGPTVIEKICATIESLLGYQYSAVWDKSFQVVSAMFDKLDLRLFKLLGNYSSYLLRGTITSLSDMQKLSDNDLHYRKQLHDCIGSAVGAMGPETFLSLVPLNLESEDLSESSVWLFPILKQHIVGARLSYFTKSILGMVGLIKQKSQKLAQEGRIFSSRSTEALVYSLWSLFPAFCNYPLDTSTSFKGLEKALCSALRDEPDVRGIICSSLQTLIQQNRSLPGESTDVFNNDISIHEKRARAYYTSQVCTDNLNALRSSAREFLSVLSGVFLSSSKDSGGCLQSTISEFASIAENGVVKRFFTSTMQKLLKVTHEATKAKQEKSSSSMQVDSENESSALLARAQLLDLAVSLLPGLDAKEIDLLFIATKPALQDSEGLVQKKAYKILSVILSGRHEFLLAKIDELLPLMMELLPSCHFAAKRHRLDCLYILIVHVFKDASEQSRYDIIAPFLTEIILAVKEANKKTRNRAYDMLIQISRACGDEQQGGKKEFLVKIFNMVAAGLTGESPQMISAAVKGLARLIYEFSDLVSEAYNVFRSTPLLLQRKNREIVKATLGLMKVLVAKSQADGLQVHLQSMIYGMLKLEENTRNHFKAKVKLLLEMLVRKCGLGAVRAVMPEEHMKLLTNIRKIQERKERKNSATSEEARSLHSKATTSRLSRWNHTKVFSDFGDDDSENSDMETRAVSGRHSSASHLNSRASSLRLKRTHQVSKSLPEDFLDQFDDDPLDLLDGQKTRSALRASENLKQKQESDDEAEIDSEGRLVIREGGRPKKEHFSDRDSDSKSHAGSHSRSRAGSRSSSNSLAKGKKRKLPDSGRAYTGKEYASKKARGDLKLKDKLEPYAYWPLDRKMMSRRTEHRAAARKGMASVVRLAKSYEGKTVSGALSVKGGLKFKRNKKKGKGQK